MGRGGVGEVAEACTEGGMKLPHMRKIEMCMRTNTWRPTPRVGRTPRQCKQRAHVAAATTHADPRHTLKARRWPVLRGRQETTGRGPRTGRARVPQVVDNNGGKSQRRQSHAAACSPHHTQTSDVRTTR
jgi:hypothetical protein